MSALKKSSGISRRTVIQGIGLAVGSIFTPAWPWLPIAEASGRIKIGVLLPQSKWCPAFSENLLAGLRLGFDHMRLPSGESGAELKVESISPGGAGAEARTEKLIGTDKVDAVVGVVSESVAARLGGLFSHAKVPLVVAGLGANIIRRNEQKPFVYHVSLDLWQASWALGAWAASSLGTKGFMAASLYDSGYDTHWAFRRGFEEGGGCVQECVVTHASSNSVNLASVIEKIGETRPDFVYASHCGNAAAEFIKTYADAGLTGRIPLTGSAFLTDEAGLQVHGEAAQGIRTCLPWSCNLDTPANRLFTAAFMQSAGRRPDVPALLGCETALLISSAWRNAGGIGGARFSEALAVAECEGPRGRARMKTDASISEGPLYLREVRQSAGMWGNEILAELPAVSGHCSSIESIRTALRSGWISPYLFV